MNSQNDLIDYRELIGRYSFAEHAKRADQYFSSLKVDSPVARKPFADSDEASELCAGISALIKGLGLFRGARVLDFGAGTCWLSKILALLGCQVTAVDVSSSALDLGRQVIQSDPIGSKLPIDFSSIADSRLPFADGSFDRVICFDALHHVPDQARAIAEFGRVLGDGGIAALNEPGPDHSRQAQSQFEMRNYGVIEADVYIEELIAEALKGGFSKASLAIFTVTPMFLDLQSFNDFLEDRALTSVGARELAKTVQESFRTRRVFFLEKGDSSAHLDSRTRAGLHATLELKTRYQKSGLKLSGEARNTGKVTWLPSGSGLGEVNLGVHLSGAQGTTLALDYARFPLSSQPIRPGESVAIDIEVPYPEAVDHGQLVFDLVAEGISWFELMGSAPIKIAFDAGATEGHF